MVALYHETSSTWNCSWNLIKYGWQIKPACIPFPRPNKIMIVIIPSQPMKTRYEDLKTFFHWNWELSCMIILMPTLDEQFKNLNSSHPREQTAEENVEKKNDCNSVQLNAFSMSTKSRWDVRSGIRTHAYKSRLRPERSALDRSAITEWTSSTHVNLSKAQIMITTCCILIASHQFSMYISWQVCHVQRSSDKSNQHALHFPGQIISRLSLSKPVNRNKICRFQNSVSTLKNENYFASLFWSQNLTSN